MYAGATAVDNGYTSLWPGWARAAWAIGLVAGVMAGVLLLLTGLGILTNDALAGVGDPSSPNQGRVTVTLFIAVYVTSLVVAVALAIALERLYHVNARRTTLVFCGGMFLAASTGHPWWLYETIRRVRWFALIGSDRAMRVVLVLFGAFCVLAGLFAKIE